MTHTRMALWMVASVGLFATAGAGVVSRFEASSARPQVSTAQVTRGDIVLTVRATGALEAVGTVQVGSQVSGRVQTLNADFNSLVHAGQILATLEPSEFEAEVEQANASVAKAEADLGGLDVSVDDAQATYDRNVRLEEKHLIAPADLEGFKVAVDLAKAEARAGAAAVTQARAALHQAELNLDRTIIKSPIDGIVLARSVDVGQTVAASMQAPTLFELAADLTHMRVNASVDESDVGSVHAGERVTFSVDAFPNETFTGHVEQVRLQPTVAQNVVTYVTVIDVENPELKLKPGMTATVSIEVVRHDNVLTVPAAALRFTPSAAALAAFGGAAPAAGGGAAAAAPAVRGKAGTLWRYVNGKLESVPVVTGTSDGVTTEIAGGSVAEGESVVTAVTTGTGGSPSGTALKTSSAASNPLLGNRPGPPMR